MSGSIVGMERGNLFEDLAGSPGEERYDELVSHPGARLERIVSTGQATPPGKWLHQGWDEWVVLLQGSAVLRFELEPEPLTLRPGDWVMIPGQIRHRVEQTDPERPTVWLALHTRPWRSRVRRRRSGVRPPS